MRAPFAWAGLLSSLASIVFGLAAPGQPAVPLAQTSLLTNTGDLSASMVAGIDRWLMRETERAAATRTNRWKRDATSINAYKRSIAPQRQRLMDIIGVRAPAASSTQSIEEVDSAANMPKGSDYSIRHVQWPVLPGVSGEGLLLTPATDPVAHVIAIPDADQTPEMIVGLMPGVDPESQFARHLAEQGCEVLVMTLVSRDDTHSGNARLNRFTNQPHREWIYRQAYELGEHVIGYDVQKVLAAVEYLIARPGASDRKVGVVGYGEGGLLALYSAALHEGIAGALVSGYFDERDQLWSEPIYRNVFGLLPDFGDAEIASLVAPRKLIVEHSRAPQIDGPPSPRPGRGGAAPGKIATPDFGRVEAEVDRANTLTAKLPGSPFVELVHGSEGMAVSIGSRKALARFLAALGVTVRQQPDRRPPTAVDWSARVARRQERTVWQLQEHTQRLLGRSESERDALTWKHFKKPFDGEWKQAVERNRDVFWREVIGRIDSPKLPPNARTRLVQDNPRWTGYEVMLDVFPDVFAWGFLLVPKDLKPGERRPVVVCQHGLEGLPEDTIADDPKHKGYGAYKGFAAKLAARGFIVYAPHNPYRGQDRFRVLQRKANPLGLSLFSFIIAQHEVTTDWLASLPFVDPDRIAFYGLSYGGKTAMRVPAVIERYCLSICSADFNDWIRKNVTTESTYSYLFTGEYEMPEWNLGRTFNYAEMAALIAPRPFMVERGHDDGVAPDTWVAYEFAKIRRMYNKLGLGDRTEIEFFDGPHTIHGEGTFRFLHKHLNWPEPTER
jgi:dienelactone hydrolase